MNEILGRFVLASEEIEVIDVPAIGHFYHVIGPVIDTDHAAAEQHPLERCHDVPAQGSYRLAGQDEVLLIEVPHGPAGEREGHRSGFARADCAFCDDAV